MEQSQSYVLIIDGGNYCSTQESVTSTRLGPGEFVDAVKVVAELERIVGCKFTTKFFFQGTQSKRPNEFHRALAQPPPHGPHFNVEIFGKKRQWGLSANNVRNEIFVEEGVDVAVATKIIECAYGIGKEEQSDKIVVITGDGDMLKAIECADAKRRNTVRVVSSRQSLSASLNSYVLIDPETSCAVYLDELMFRCVNKSSGGNGSSSDNNADIRNTSMPSNEIIPTGQMPEVYFNQGSSSSYNRGDNNRRGGGGRNHLQRPPKEGRSNRFDRNRFDQHAAMYTISSSSANAVTANELLRTETVTAVIDRSGGVASDTAADLQGFKTVQSKLKRKLRKQLSDGREQLSDIDEDDQYDHPNNHKIQNTSSATAGSGAGGVIVSGALSVPGVRTLGGSSSSSGAVGGHVSKYLSSGLVPLPDIDQDSESDSAYATDASDAIQLPAGMGHLSKNQRRKLRKKMKKEKQARAQAEARAAVAVGGGGVLGMRPIGAKEGERVTVDLVDDEEGGFPSLTIHGQSSGYARGVISID